MAISVSPRMIAVMEMIRASMLIRKSHVDTESRGVCIVDLLLATQTIILLKAAIRMKNNPPEMEKAFIESLVLVSLAVSVLT